MNAGMSDTPRTDAQYAATKAVFSDTDNPAAIAFLTLARQLESELMALRSASVDKKRMDFMDRFIVEGTCPEGGKIAWRADVDCLREMIDEAMRVASDRNNAARCSACQADQYAALRCTLTSCPMRNVGAASSNANG